MKKTFSTEAVFTVVTGIVLCDYGLAAEVMDHLYPGIMTIGQAAMQGHASEAIQLQHPKMREFLRTATPAKEDWQAFNTEAKLHFGSELEIEGPLNPSNETISEAFAAFGKA